jgi:hypothetical protein
MFSFGNYPEENIKHAEHGESLKSRRNETVKSTVLPQTVARRST